MDQFSATDAALAGFRVAREKPKTVAIWAGLMAILSFIVAIVAVSTFGDKLTGLAEALEGEPDPQTTLAAMRGMWPLFLGSALYVLVTNAILTAAVNRVVLRPQDSAGAYLRLGADELRQAAAQLLLYVVLFGAYLIGGVAAVILGGLGAAIGGAALGVLLGVTAFAGLLAGLVFLSVRLSFVNTLAFDTRRIDLGASWTLTKGRFWPLFGTYLIAMVLAVVVYLLLFVMIAAVGAIASTAMGGGLAAAGDALRNEAATLKDLLSVAGVVRSLLSGLTSILLSLIVFAPAPTIYAQLKGRDVTETFG
ncbi:hypothetical protein [Caulobacter sp. Root1455]|uniref:hypothetical protein n=1 Tax=Caulobacter sp. Root1455 TaxID=1736465 RepID=UPI0012E35601|nr:hypothetical protein [Caulobacter sp. Root1455]